MAKTRNLFLSHSWTYCDQYERLIALLMNRPYFSFRDYSVPKDDPIHNAPTSAALYRAIKNKIAPCHVVLVMAGKYATYSPWIQKEIHIAKQEFSSPKPVLGIRPWATTQVSSYVLANADQLVGWNTESVVSAIQRLS